MVVTDFATAELVKVAANAFLATKISFINAMAEVCEAAGADVTQLARAIGYDAADRQQVPPRRASASAAPACPRTSARSRPAPRSSGVGEALRFLHEVDLINQRRRQRVVQLAAELLGRAYGPAGPDLAGTADRRARRHLQAQLRRRTRLAGAGGGPQAGPRRRARSPSTTRRAWRTPAGTLPDLTYAKTPDRRGHRRRPGLRADRVGGVPQRRPASRSASWSPASRSSTAGTASTRRSGRAPAGSTGAWGDRSLTGELRGKWGRTTDSAHI